VIQSILWIKVGSDGQETTHNRHVRLQTKSDHSGFNLIETLYCTPSAAALVRAAVCLLVIDRVTYPCSSDVVLHQPYIELWIEIQPCFGKICIETAQQLLSSNETELPEW
jgi:hypothetical protein